MDYQTEILAAHTDPQTLESLYQAARKAGEADQFSAGLAAAYAQETDSLLFAAWHYRLLALEGIEAVKQRVINWGLVVPISLISGLLSWIVSDPDLEFSDVRPFMPYFGLLWAPIVGLLLIAYFALTTRKDALKAVIVSSVITAAVAYVFANSPWDQHYRQSMAAHLPLLTWIGVGAALLGWRPDAKALYAFLHKSIEAVVTGGLFLAAVYVFVGITFGLFNALNVEISDEIMRLGFAGGAGVIAVIAVAIVYDPKASPLEQDFERGISRLVATVPRFMLLPTILVGLIYLGFIPFNFSEPFKNRDVLIIYNLMLFAIMGLLVGVTPISLEGLSVRVQKWLRTGIIVLTVLVIVVSLYAMSATVYRTVEGGITQNRLTIIGWNSINIGILIYLLVSVLRAGKLGWLPALHQSFKVAAVAYLAWTAFLILAIPILFS